MLSKFTKIVNFEEELSKTEFSISAVDQAYLQNKGDYGLVVFKLKANQKQKPHFHTYGDIDIFSVVSGGGFLHLAKVEDDKVVAGTEEKIPLKKGDTYCIEPYTLHSVEAGEEDIVLLNVAPNAHSAPAEGEEFQRGIDIFFPK